MISRLKIFTTILILALFSACTPQKRLKRLLSHNPELKTIDTLKLRDTVIFNRKNTDTVFKFKKNDTIWCDDIRLIIKDSNIYLETFYKPDTVYKNIKIPVDRFPVVKVDKLDKILGFLPWICAVVIVFILSLVAKKIFS